MRCIQTWHWILAHKTLLIGVGLGIGAIVRYGNIVLGWVFKFSENRDKKETRRLAALDLETRGTAQKVQIYARACRAAGNNPNMRFSEEDLRSILLPQQAERLFAAINLLRKDGFAEETEPGYWKIQ